MKLTMGPSLLRALGRPQLNREAVLALWPPCPPGHNHIVTRYKNSLLKRTCRLSALLLALSCVAMPQGLLAQHGENADKTELHQNHFSVFLGGTTESEEDETTTSFSIGVEYERRLSRLLGIGFGAEYVFVDVG